MVGREDWARGGRHVPQMWRRGRDTRTYSVPVYGYQRLKDIRGRREWVRENNLRWDSWEALAAK